MKPGGPCFESGPRGYFSSNRAFTPQEKMKLLGLFSGFYEQLTVFDAHGKAWRVIELRSRHKTRWFHVLVRLFYNPWVDVEFVWRAPIDYQLEDLKACYIAAVEADDDILTQFVEQEELKEKIGAAGSFAELSRIYQWAQKESP
jgi:hypothetical protein